MTESFGLENSLVYKTVTQGIISPHFDTLQRSLFDAIEVSFIFAITSWQ